MTMVRGYTSNVNNGDEESREGGTRRGDGGESFESRRTAEVASLAILPLSLKRRLRPSRSVTYV